MKKLIYFLLVALLCLAAFFAGNYSKGAPKAENTAAATQKKEERKILYYRNPMGQPDTSPAPKKDEMGMDYIPVYADEALSSSTQVKVSPEKIQKLGVKTEKATFRELSININAVGYVDVDEKMLFVVSPKFDGWIEKLYANKTGEFVSKGQKLFSVYSPELLSALSEYELALKGKESLKQANEGAKEAMNELANSAVARLKNWDIGSEQLTNDGDKQRKVLIYRSPANGVILEKQAVEGKRFMAGETLYKIADVSHVWVLADVYERDIASVAQSASATITLQAYPDMSFPAKIDYIYPTVNTQSRTVKVRLVVDNKKMLLKPAMYASVRIDAAKKAEKALSIPLSAVIAGGESNSAIVEVADGLFEPRKIKLGRSDREYAEILSGVGEGEKVVTSANFLIDSESNLKAAFSTLEPAKGQ